MTLDQLWAGWRSSYVSSYDASAAGSASDGTGCVFCRLVAERADAEAHFVVHTGELVSAVLNAYPYAPGHLLVLPIRHVQDLAELTDDEASELWRTVHDAAAALRRAYHPDGLNIGLNLGRAAGAGIPAHLHAHVVPRWAGDTNFMTSVASARVLPEALGDTWAKLRDAWA